MQLVLPRTLPASLAAAHGRAGAAWLRGLPAVVGGLAERWRLRLTDVLPAGGHLLLGATGPDGRRLVLKLAPPGLEADRRERVALLAAAGRGTVAVEAHEAGALLLPRVTPGDRAEALLPRRDAAATAALAGVARRLAAAPVAGVALPGPAELAAELEAGRAALPAEYLDAAAGLLRDLLGAGVPDVLLHGDLQHRNLLRDEQAEAGWTAVAPVGRLGDPAFEAAAALAGPLPPGRGALLRALPARLEQWAAELDVPAERITAWAVVAGAVAQLRAGSPHRAVPALVVGRQLLTRRPAA